MRGLLAIDLDGTLLGPDRRTVPSEALCYLSRLADLGVHVVPASGRALGMMAYELMQLSVASHVIASSGACILTRTGNVVLARRGVGPSAVRQIHDALRSVPSSFELYHAGTAYIERERVDTFSSAFDADIAEHLLSQSVVVDTVEPLLGVPGTEKLNVSWVAPAARPSVVDRLASIEGLDLTGSSDASIEITARGVDKGSAVAWLAARLGISMRDVAAVGDSDNDASMLSAAGTSFAMGNATLPARRAAAATVAPGAAGLIEALRAICGRFGECEGSGPRG